MYRNEARYYIQKESFPSPFFILELVSLVPGLISPKVSHVQPSRKSFFGSRVLAV